MESSRTIVLRNYILEDFRLIAFEAIRILNDMNDILNNA